MRIKIAETQVVIKSRPVVAAANLGDLGIIKAGEVMEIKEPNDAVRELLETGTLISDVSMDSEAE